MTEHTDPNRHIPFLVHEVARLIHRTYDQRMKPLGITQAQWRVLGSLSFHDGVSQAELAESIEYGPVTLCGILDRLEDNDWIARQPDLADRRVKKVYLTPKAAGVVEIMQNIADEMMNHLLSGISQDESDQLIGTLNALKQNLQVLDGNSAIHLVSNSSRKHIRELKRKDTP